MSQQCEPDTVGVQPAARPIVATVACRCIECLGSSLVTLVAHGSAVKGDYIPGCSDLDLVALVAPAILHPSAQIGFRLAADLYRGLCMVDPAPFHHIQLYVRPAGQGSIHAFVPGAYHIVLGEASVPLAAAETLFRSARAALEQLNPAEHEERIASNLLARGPIALDQELRFLCTDVWPTLYHGLIQSGHDPLEVWRLPKTQAIARTDSMAPIGQTIRAFYASLIAQSRDGTPDVEEVLRTIERGVAFLRAAKAHAWAAGTGSEC